MNCCKESPISERGLCKEHFSEWLENSVAQTIKEYSMINPQDRVLVAASGGKDSLTVLKILKKLGFNVTALCIDEGISNYREHTIVDLEKFCTEHDISLSIKTFEKEKGTKLETLNPTHPCTTCGVWRRDLLASGAKDFDVIATGHNLDDEAQSILMNVFKNHPMRPAPVLAANKAFTKRVKPLYFISEADIRRYAYIHDLVSVFTECPNADSTFRRTIQNFLENRERETPGAKERIVRSYALSLSS